MKDNNIVPLYIPAACTDVLQECDTVINAVWKRSLKSEFSIHTHRLFETWLASNPQDVWAFRPVLTMGALKPHITTWVQAATNALKSEDMKAAIIRSFAEDGLFREMRSPCRVAEARESIDNNNLPQVDVVVPSEQLADELELVGTFTAGQIVDANDENLIDLDVGGLVSTLLQLGVSTII